MEPNDCLFSIVQPPTVVEGILGAECCQGPRTEARCLTRPPNFDKWHDDRCYTCSHFYYQPATLLGPDYQQLNLATWVSSNAVPQATSRRAPTPTPGVVLWFWHPASSWVPAPSHGLIMRLNWWFSLIFASFNVLNPIRKAYLNRASCTWHIDPHGCYLGWTPPGLILPRPQTLLSVPHSSGIEVLQ